jgi:hypothetical protein
MARQYSVSFTSVAATAAQDLFEITAATGKPVRINGWCISQSTEIKDAEEEGLSILVRRGSSATTSGSGGTSATPALQDSADSAAGATVEVNNTTRMSGGTITTLEALNWNVRAPFLMIYTPEMKPRITPGDRLTIELATAPADSVTISGTVWFQED